MRTNENELSGAVAGGGASVEESSSRLPLPDDGAVPLSSLEEFGPQGALPGGVGEGQPSSSELVTLPLPRT